MKKFLIITLLATLFVGALNAQIMKPVKWKISTKKVSAGVYDIVCDATIDAGWHLYDSELPDGGPLPTSFNIDEDETEGIEVVGKFKSTTEPKKEFSESFGIELKYFEKKATFIQRVKVTKKGAKLIGYVEFMACSGGQCIPPGEEDFEFELEK